jgi:hypothetical protein
VGLRALFRGIALLLLSTVMAGQAFAADPQLTRVAQEARQTIAVIDWFYLRHGACPQPSRMPELLALQSGLGDGFTLDLQGQFAAIRGISMTDVWFYYASPAHPDKCTLWRKLGWDPALIWRRNRGGGRWVFDPGDGSAERPFRLNP